MNISREQYMQRLTGVVSGAIGKQHVLVVGVGGGADMVAKLARHGIGHLTLVDHDVVEPANLCRTLYTTDNLGQPKVVALQEHLRRAAPLTTTTTYTANILTWTPEEVRARLESVDLLIAGTDTFEAQALINTWSQQYNIPAVFVGIHEASKGGMIVWSIPNQTACYRCICEARYEAREDGKDTSLHGATGSMADIAFIDNIALKLVLGILERGQASQYGRWFTSLKPTPDQSARNQVVVRMDPTYTWEGVDLFDVVLSDLPTSPKRYQAELEAQAFFACDSLWLVTTPNPNCPDCLKQREVSCD